MPLRVISLIALMMALASGQSAASGQSGSQAKFDVASVKPCDPHVTPGTNAGTAGRGRVTYNCEPLMNYIRSAYGRFANGQLVRGNIPVNIEGGPAWINTELYQITAKAEGAATVGMTVGPMMQALLEERFKLKIHRETREVPVYALVVSKGGIRLPAAQVACFTQELGHPRPPLAPGQTPPPMCGWGREDGAGIQVHGSTMADFCLALSGLPLRLDRRRIIDKTGIAGQFDFDLKFSPEDSAIATEQGIPASSAAAGDPAPDLTRLQGALRRVGLQLAPAKGTAEVIVIDHAERPSEN
jgi:uncharacterized protein (TIGR03435 family)